MQSKMKCRINLLNIFKIFPEMSWGEYDTQCEIQQNEVVGNTKYEFDSGKKKKSNLSNQTNSC